MISQVNNIRENGLSLRTLFAWLVVLAIILSALMIYSTYHLSDTFYSLSNAMDEYIDLQKAAYELMAASDYLTEKTQRFTIEGRMQYLEEYLEEAFETRRREGAIERMSRNANSAAALARLEEAMERSRDLMNIEYYAMKLVIEAQGCTDYPDVLRDVELTTEDAALSADEKMKLATEKVLSEEYYAEKDLIRSNMQDSLDELEKLARESEGLTASNLRVELLVGRIIILIQAAGIFVLIWLTSTLGISPVLKAVERIKDDSPIPEVGANEFRYLARTYNRMYNVYKKSIEHLNYKASHDELTNVYNRTGYDLLLSSVELASTYLLLFDVDDFKKINDGRGHETGDRILVKLADTLRKNFRSDDYICRIGGDEFVVFMLHASHREHKLISAKIRQINAELANTEDGLPPVSVSVGIAHGTQADSASSLFTKADEAMYKAKRSGKRGHSFYNEK